MKLCHLNFRNLIVKNKNSLSVKLKILIFYKLTKIKLTEQCTDRNVGEFKFQAWKTPTSLITHTMKGKGFGSHLHHSE